LMKKHTDKQKTRLPLVDRKLAGKAKKKEPQKKKRRLRSEDGISKEKTRGERNVSPLRRAKRISKKKKKANVRREKRNLETRRQRRN